MLRPRRLCQADLSIFPPIRGRDFFSEFFRRGVDSTAGSARIGGDKAVISIHGDSLMFVQSPRARPCVDGTQAMIPAGGEQGPSRCSVERLSAHGWARGLFARASGMSGSLPRIGRGRPFFCAGRAREETAMRDVDTSHGGTGTRRDAGRIPSTRNRAATVSRKGGGGRRRRYRPAGG